VFLFTLVGLLAIIPPRGVGAQEMPNLFSEKDIGTIENLVLETDTVLPFPFPIRIAPGYLADVYFPAVPDTQDEFPVVAVLQGANVDKGLYSELGTRLARFGFVVVIPNRSPVPFPLPFDPFPDEFVIWDILAQMEWEDEEDENSELFGIVDTDRMGLTGHSAGGAASLFAIGRSCQPPFCFGPSFFPLPEAVQAGAFYGTNTIDPETGDPIAVNTYGIPVALVQGLNDGISTPDEAEATIAVIDKPRELIYILNENNGANHYGITDVNNPPGAVPDPNPQFISQQVSIKKIALAIGQFLFEELDGDD
jgi:dienelactone hydrolase